VNISASYPVPEIDDDPRFRTFFKYWMDIHQGSALPRRSDIDPLDIPSLLGHLNLIDVLRDDGGIRYRYALWGTKVATLYGADYTGRFLEDIMIPTQFEAVREAFNVTVETGLPHYWKVPIPIENREFVSSRRLLLPLSQDGQRVTHMIALMLGEKGRSLARGI
jgi:hypothetical protein